MTELTNFYNEIQGGSLKSKRDKHFKKHLIEPNSMILCIGGTGSGKSNSLINFLSRKNSAFNEIIIFTGSTDDEPLYNLIRQRIPSTQLYTDIEELPELTEFDNENKKLEKLPIFDDFIGLKKSEMVKINKYLPSGRKFGFTCWLMSQNHTSVPKVITRNTQYFIVFKLNDNTTINNIFRNHNIEGIDRDTFRSMYLHSTSEKVNFFMIDLKNREWMLRRNFIEILTV